MRVTDIDLQWEDTRGMQVCIDIGNQSDGYRLTVGVYSGMEGVLVLVMRVTYIVLQSDDTRGMQTGIDLGNESDGYRLTMGGYSGNEGRYRYWYW